MKKWILGIGIIILLCFLWSFGVINGAFKVWDNQILEFITSFLRKDLLIACFKGMTFLVSAIWFLCFTIITFLFFKNKWIGIMMGINTLLIAGFNLILKDIFAISRPVYALIEEIGYSYPSGHAMASLAFYGFLIYLIYKLMRKGFKRSFLIIFLLFLILAIGFSRIYLGVHYPSDIIGGYLFSFGYLLVFILGLKKLGLEKLLCGIKKK